MPRIHDWETDIDAAAYWTAERMQAARPLGQPVISQEQFRTQTQKLDPAPATHGVPIERMASKGALGLPWRRFVHVVEANDGLGEAAEPTPTAVNRPPFWNAGKLFVETSDGPAHGSAQFCGNGNIILTAAHCVRNGTTSEEYKNIVFVRAYSGGAGQMVRIKRVLTWDRWLGPRYAFDYAFLTTEERSGAGWLGLKTQLPYTAWTAIGYPLSHDEGELLHRVDGSKGSQDGGIVQMRGNPMQGGCSGGAWLADVSTKPKGNYAVGINSFGLEGEPDCMYSPLFDEDTHALYQQALNSLVRGS